MKKVLMLIFSICFILCGCSSKVEEQTLVIPFQKLASCNNRTRLLEKYNHISERTASRPLGETEFKYWVMYYEKENDNINAIVDYSEEYKCFYYNNNVYADYGDGFLRTVIPYREEYQTIVSGLLARTDTLSYVFITESRAEQTKDGYKTAYEFIVNNDILPEFEGLGVNLGDKMCIEYDIDNDYIIKRCRYYLINKTTDKMKQVARIDITYNQKKEFPDQVGKDTGAEKVNVRVIENFGTGSEYSESFEIAKGSYISENEILLKNYLYKDPMYVDYFDSATEMIDKDIDIFIIDSSFAYMIEARDEYMEGLENGEIAESEEIITE